MPDEVLIRHCSPTLAGIKTGNIFTCTYDSKESMMDEIREINHKISPRGLCLIPMKFSKGKVLLYLYRPDRLGEDLSGHEAVRILEECGYRHFTRGACLSELIKRLNTSEVFPHEIGLFLSYPTEDVRGFIENHASGYKYSGLWKVYGDVSKARKTFATYQKCTDVYRLQLKHGKSLADLAVRCKA